MFRYINMPKLVAFYLREFSVRTDGEPSNLYKFIFCLCLPFVSRTFNRARLVALAIAECTNSRDQIFRVLEKITSVGVHDLEVNKEYYVSYDGTNALPDFAYNTDSDIGVTFGQTVNSDSIYISLRGASQSEVEAYLYLLIPFYVEIKIEFLP